MAITVDTDTYVTIAEADAYLALRRVSTDTQLVAWAALSDGDKEIYLRNAADAIERLRFPGRKYRGSLQTLAFPRVQNNRYPYRREAEDYTVSPVANYDYDSSAPTVPDEVKHAQIEEALELASPSSDTELADAYNSAVKSYSIGHLSETYKDYDSAGIKAIIKSLKAQRLLSPHMGGGFRVG